MIIRRVDADNDWQFGRGVSDYATDDSAVQQNIKTRILSWIGDCFFAPDEGIDWKERLDIGQQELLIEEVKSCILQSYGVVRIINFTSTFIPQTRTISMSYDIQTIFSMSLRATLQLPLGG